MSNGPGNSLTSATAFSPSLEAIRLAAQMYNAAREGNKKVLEEAIEGGLPPNLTNEKGDTLVSQEFDVLSLAAASHPPAPRGPELTSRAAHVGGILRSCGSGRLPYKTWS